MIDKTYYKDLSEILKSTYSLVCNNCKKQYGKWNVRKGETGEKFLDRISAKKQLYFQQKGCKHQEIVAFCDVCREYTAKLLCVSAVGVL